MRHKPFRLRTMITLWFVVLLVTWSALVLVFLEHVLSRGVRQFFRDRGKQLVRVVATESVPLAQYEENLALHQLFQRTMNSFPGIRYMAMLDADGNPIVSTFPDGMPGDLHMVKHSFDSGQNVSVRLIRAGGQLLYDYECRRAGLRVRLGTSLRPVEDLVQSLTTYVLCMGAVGFLVVFAVAFRISRPVESLSQAVEDIVQMGERVEGATPTEGTLETRTIAVQVSELVAR
ncbi:MAG: PDC sensor domain-containing protein, partial [Planctomycetota bacterium]